ncbi:uncharacterized protein LOC118503403 isoform X1 [Anopheles stephensi]|uniref:uncharacterized protein LOC118503403 isoform X1 n=1 Tax=Anopheles stephensi TaxID=30069 RepID=UPI0016589193|nr:uncharacterized protein LOC118503403 isoform X1 [Anopheles stephensi]XP_035892500.1 uncharacterized protein LOC118503403 isoform X1 [Anopheles stephensi]
MSRNLCDETFPSSLLIEFDELDDEIPISPELPKRHHHSDGKGIVTDKTNIADDRNGSRMVISGSSNTSSGHSSLSTEGENRSASSDRDTSRDLSKRQPSDPGALLLLGDQRSAKLSLKSRKIRQPRSMESLLQTQGQSVGRLKLASPLGSGTGLGASKGMGGGSTGNVSVSSAGSTAQQQQQQQHYNRHRSKYGHVQSKVKQMIEEMKPPTSRDRKTLVRHKSMPETSFEVDAKTEKDETLEQENDVETLRSAVREMRLHMSSLEQELTVCRTNLFNELATLQCKNNALRMENDRLLEQEQAHEQRRQQLREQQAAGSCYGSQSSLYKASVRITCTVATQTSPSATGDHESQFDFLLASPPPASHPAAHTSSSTIELESAVGEFSPDYEQLIPTLDRSGTSTVFGSGIRNREVRRTPSFRSPTGRRSESSQAGDFALSSPTCHDCRRRKKKRKSRKQKLASLFCIRHHDESL